MKNKKWIGRVILLVVVIALLISPFLLIHGKYSFHDFWSWFFTTIFSWQAFTSGFWPIIQKIPTTLLLTGVSMILGLLLGLALALISINKIPVLNQIRLVFVSFIRGTPIIVQLFLTYYGLPLILKAINYNYGTDFIISDNSLLFVIITFALNEAAYGSETIRSAIQSVDKGQIEAAYSLGMPRWKVFYRVTLPEAATVAAAPLGNALIGLLKGTSLAFVASVVEMTAQAQIIGNSTFRSFELYMAVALLYWPMCIVLEIFIHLVEKKLEIKMPNNKAGITWSRNPFDNKLTSKKEVKHD